MQVAEVFLGAFLQVLFDRLASPVLLKFATRAGISSRLDELKENLRIIKPVITNVENMLVRDAVVNEWFEELGHWAYDADDFLDELNTRAMQEEEARLNNTSSSFSVHRWVSDIASGFNFGGYSEKLDQLNGRWDAIYKRIEKTHNLMRMTATDNTSPPPATLQRPLEATAHAYDARVFGREHEKEKIIEQLKSSGGANVEVIPIVGMPGIGKTTVARHVYESMQQQEPPLFDIEGWVCVSEDFDVERITTDILESFTSPASNLRGLHQLQSELKKKVKGKRFLLVLDDVWTSNYREHWDPLRAPFGAGAPGSKIIVTTRDDRVASMMQTDDQAKIHRLGTLCDDDCWSVFLQHVVDKRNPVLESEAGRFRGEILDKCKGLPLTAKLLAGLLRGESPGQGWEAKLNSSIWDVKVSGRKGYPMPPGVMLSYFHLPPQLKRCFSYCSVIPEDYEFGEEEVVMLWMAHGLVSPEGDDEVEVTGCKYFREFVSRSLFQPAPNKHFPFSDDFLFAEPINDSPRFLMHDLINDMAEMVAGKSCLKLDGVPKIDCSSLKTTKFPIDSSSVKTMKFPIDSSSVKARYSSYRNFSGHKTEFVTFEREKYLREFQSFGHSEIDNLSSYVPLLMELKYLRVLCLRSYSVTELPEDIGDLIHLRIVDLSHTYIREFPESTGSLYNLLALKLKDCERLRTLPAQTRKLINLRNLDCSGPNKLVAMPVGKLTSLQKLSYFIVGKGLEQGVGQLKDLSHLKGISISCLENVCNSKEAREVNLMGKEGLKSLELKWNSDHGDFLQGAVFAELQPHKHLEKLIINGYGGLSFPGWVGHDRFSKMKVIRLEDCKKCTSLPPLGKLSGLEEIRIRKMAGIVRAGEEFYGKEEDAFPLLKILQFQDMENWFDWSHPAGGSSHFASLQKLLVMDCPKLSMSLPDVINVKKLIVRKCDKLLVAFPRQSFLEMDIRECKLEFMERLQKDEDASQLLPSVASSLIIVKADVLEAVESARTRMNITNKYVVEALHQMMMLRSLTALVVASIPNLTHLPGVVLLGLPKLETLRICRCKELTSLWKMDEIGRLILPKQNSHFLSSLCVLEVEECCQLVCLVTQGGEGNDTNRDRHIRKRRRREAAGRKQQCLGLPCGLETLRLKNCDKLEKLPSDLHNLTSLSELEISDCDMLEKLPSDLHNLTSLSVLKISLCRELEKLPSDMLNLTSLSGLKISLRRQRWKPLSGLGDLTYDPLLKVLECPKREKPASELHTLTSSSELVIWGCDKLEKLPSELHNLTSLSELKISDCDMLEKLPSDLHNLTSLRSLRIESCRRLSCLSEMGFPSTLESLVIRKCELLTGLSPSLSSSSHSLKDLEISNCKNLESIIGTADSFPSLESLRIEDCPKLKSLPEGRHRRLSSLTIIACKNLGELFFSVHHLPALETLLIRVSPAGLFSIQQGGPNPVPPNLRELDIAGPMTPDDEQLFNVPLPSSLTSLRITEFKKLSPEAFQNLTSLEYLEIWDCLGLTSLLLPPSLLSLEIWYCRGLTSIPDQLLPPSLLSLKIHRCRDLTSIPDQLLLPSLRYIFIEDCPGLTSIPDQLLPSSLLALIIRGCRLLTPHFAKEKGRYWPKVKFIPRVIINGRSIFDAEEVE